MTMYSLKIYDETLVKFEMENKPTLKITDITVVSDKKNLFPEAIKLEVNSETLREFLQQRIVPKNRTFVKNILETQNLDYRDIKGIIDISKGLSLTDCYWITTDDIKFKDYNLDYGSGEIIGEAILIDCILVTDEFENKLYNINPLVYGKSEHPRVYAWKLENVIKYNNRIPCKGKLGLWNYDIHN